MSPLLAYLFYNVIVDGKRKREGKKTRKVV